MSKFLKASVVALLGLSIFAMPAFAQQTAPAEKKEPPKTGTGGLVEVQIPFAVLDVQRILREASAVKSIRDQITKFGSAFEAEIQKERDAIRTANQELARQRTILTPEAFAEKRRKFEQRVVEVQRLVQQRQRELDRSRNEAMLEVNKAYTEIVGKLAVERNLALILRKLQTTYSVSTLDITKDVLTRLDKRLPTVKVTKPGTAESEKTKPGK